MQNCKIKKLISFFTLAIIMISLVGCTGNEGINETKISFKKVDSIIDFQKFDDKLYAFTKGSDNKLEIMTSRNKGKKWSGKELKVDGVDLKDSTILGGAMSNNSTVALYYGYTNKLGNTEGDTKEVIIFDLSGKNVSIKISSDEIDKVFKMLFVNDDLIVISTDGDIFQYSSQDGSLKYQYKYDTKETIVSACGIKDKLVIATNKDAKYYDVSKGKESGTIKELENCVEDGVTLYSNNDKDIIYFYYNESLYSYDFNKDKVSAITKKDEETKFSDDNLIPMSVASCSNKEFVGVFLDLNCKNHLYNIKIEK